MKKSRLRAIGFSFLFSLTVVFLMDKWLQSSPQETPSLPMVKVLVASESLPEGALIFVSKMAWKEIPSPEFHEDFIEEGHTEKIDEIDEGVLKVPLSKGAFVRSSQILKTRGKSPMASIIQEGMRAVSIPYSKLANVPSLIAPGDIVDLLLPKKRLSDPPSSPSEQMILTGIRVLAVNSELYRKKYSREEKEREPSKANGEIQTLTFELSRDQAEHLANSIRDGQIVITIQSLLDKTSPQQVQSSAPPAPPPLPLPSSPAPAPIEPRKNISIIRGSSRQSIPIPQSIPTTTFPQQGILPQGGIPGS